MIALIIIIIIAKKYNEAEASPEFSPKKYPENSDVYLVEHEYISITPLMKSLFSIDLYNRLKNNLK